MAKLARRKDVKPIKSQLDAIFDSLADHSLTLSRLSRELTQPTGVDLERVETLLNGVKAVLERMGGNVLPSAMADVHALRDQMSEFRRELSGYRSMLMVLSRKPERRVARA